MKRFLTALLIGSVFVCIVTAIGRHDIGTPIPFWLLLPGLLAGVSVPGSGFELKEDHPLSLPATIVLFAVNIGLYSGLTYLILSFIHRLRRASKQAAGPAG